MKNLLLVLACTIIGAATGAGQSVNVSSQNPLAPSIAFPADQQLIQTIRSAPEAEPGRPGLYFIDISTTSDYQIVGIRRTRTGKSELHAGVTDVWYVLQGAATLVCGGTLTDSVEVQSGEFRGSGVNGGAKRVLHTGDFAVIPPGIAHWASRIKGKEFMYIVVKIPAAKKQQ